MKKILILICVVLLMGCGKTVYVKEIEKSFSEVNNEEEISLVKEHFDFNQIKIEKLEYTFDTSCIYRVKDLKTSRYYLMIKGDNVITMDLMYLDKIYEMDSDGDGHKEIFILTDIGSGLRIPLGMHVDLKDFSQTTSTIGRTDAAFYDDPIVLVAEDLSVKVYPYYAEFDRIGSEAIGTLDIGETIKIKVGE